MKRKFQALFDENVNAFSCYSTHSPTRPSPINSTHITTRLSPNIFIPSSPLPQNLHLIISQKTPQTPPKPGCGTSEKTAIRASFRRNLGSKSARSVAAGREISRCRVSDGGVTGREDGEKGFRPGQPRRTEEKQTDFREN